MRESKLIRIPATSCRRRSKEGRSTEIVIAPYDPDQLAVEDNTLDVDLADEIKACAKDEFEMQVLMCRLRGLSQDQTAVIIGSTRNRVNAAMKAIRNRLKVKLANDRVSVTECGD